MGQAASKTERRCLMIRSNHDRLRDLATRFVANLVVVFLLFGPYLANLLSHGTRYLSMWRTSDTILVLFCMLSLAFACVAVDGLVRRLGPPWLIRLVGHLFVLAFGAGLLTNLWFHNQRVHGYHISQYGMEMRTLWLALVAVVAFSLARPQSRLVARCRQVCLVLSPAVVILVFQMFVGRTYLPAMDPLPSPAAEADAPAAGRTPPVYVFLFDAWSYDRTYDESGKLRSIFPNLARLSERAVVLHDAHSPGADTNASIPRILYSTPLAARWNSGRCAFERDGELVPSTQFESIFARARAGGAQTFMVGYCMPFRELLGDQVDTYRCYPWLPQYRHPCPMAETLVHAFRATQYWTDPWSPLLQRKLVRRVDDSRALRLFADLNADVLSILTEQSSHALAVFHHPVPHNPYLLNPDGSYRGPVDPEAWSYDYEDGYERNLGALDQQIGEFMNGLQAAGRFDEALLILTSDHAWSQDPAGAEDRPMCDRTHVPLIIKLPGQKTGTAGSALIETWRLGELIAEVTSGTEVTPERAEQLLAATKLPTDRSASADHHVRR